MTLSADIARVSLVTEDQAPMGLRSLFADGDPGTLIRSLAQVPEILEVTLPFVAAVLGPTSLDERTKEIVILRTSAILECRFCVTTHAVAALDSGLTWAEIEALRNRSPGAGQPLPEPEAALVRWVDAVASGTATPDDQTFVQVRAHWPETAVIELTLLVGATMMLNRFATAFGLPPSPEAVRRLGAAAQRAERS